MEDFDIFLIASKSVKGVFALVSRTFLIQLISVGAQFILAAYLDTASFGVFFVVSSIVVFLTYFQDIGLAASLIQKKEEPTLDELRSSFTLQQCLVLCIVIPTLLFSRQIANFYHLNDQGYWLLISFVVSFLLSSLRTIPTILLERHLEFSKLVVPQIVENLIYSVTLIICSIMGFGITTFTIAVFLRSIVGLILLYIIQPWDIGIAFNRQALKSLLSFGLPFQANTMLALFKDDLLNLYVGRVLPLSQVGYIGFSQKWAFTPLRLFLDNVIKITFPSYSRLQHNKEALRIAIEKSLFLLSAFLFPASVGMVLFAPYFLEFIPKYNKWEPALLSLLFFSINAVISAITTPVTNFLNAIGKAKVTLYFMLFWATLTWIATIFGIRQYGYNGVAMASSLVSLTSLFVLVIARRYVAFSFTKPIYKQIIASILMGLFIYLCKSFISNLETTILGVFVAIIVYFLILFLLARNEILSTVKFVIKSVKYKHE